MEIQNTYEEIIRNSLHHIICIDDDFIEPYKSTEETNKKNVEFSQSMYFTLKDRCDGHVELQKYYGGIEKKDLEKCMRNKDLLVLDWELTGSNDKPALEIIAQAVSLEVPFICVYTNRSDIENIYTVIRDYFSGYSISTVEEACDKWMDAGVFEEEFKSDVIELFSDADEKMSILIKRLNLGDEETKNVLKNLEYRNKESWRPLYLKWNNSILPEKPLPKVKNPSAKEAIIIDGKVIICLSKSGSDAKEAVCIDDLIPSIARHITNVPNSIFDIVWLYYTNSLRKVLQARSNLFFDIDPKALGWLAKGLLVESSEVFDNFMKGLYRDEIMDCLGSESVRLPKSVIEDIKLYNENISPDNAKKLMELNERITVNHLYSGIKHKIDFGDIFVVEQEPDKNTFWLCVTAKCECLRESKIDNNYLFIKGTQIIKPSTAIKNAESEFRSFVKYKGETISIKWSSKLSSIYFKPGENMIDGIGKVIIGSVVSETNNAN